MKFYFRLILGIHMEKYAAKITKEGNKKR